MTRGMPRSQDIRRRISQKLKGTAKSPETRAAMSASKLCSKTANPELWQKAYETKLAAILFKEELKKKKTS